jgi:nitroreductase
MGLEEAVRARRSVRGFLDQPVPRDVLERVFEIAQQAPSNCNVQPWQVYVASGACRDRLRTKMMEAIMAGEPSSADYKYSNKFEGEHRKRQVACAVALYTKMEIGRDDSAGRARASLRNFELFDAPHVVFIGMDRAYEEAVAVDVGMYGQTLMLAMTAHGIGSCPQACMRYYPNLVREEFGLPEDTCILYGISFGYEDTEVKANETRTVRESIADCVVFKED